MNHARARDCQICDFHRSLKLEYKLNDMMVIGVTCSQPIRQIPIYLCKIQKKVSD